MVIFCRQQDKGEVFENLKNLKELDAWDKSFEIQAGEQRDLRSLAAFAKDLGHDAIVKAGQLLLDGR